MQARFAAVMGTEEWVNLLRTNNAYWNKADTWGCVAEQAGEIVAFTILSKTDEAEAEFRIALRVDKIGLGGVITSMTLAKGLVEIKLACIHLIVRRHNPRAIRLYKRAGFTESGECLKHVNGKQVNFLTMAISRESYTAFSG